MHFMEGKFQLDFYCARRNLAAAMSRTRSATCCYQIGGIADAAPARSIKGA